MNETRRMPKSLILGLCAGYFLVLLDVTVVNIALPQINADLQAGQAGMAGVVNAYTFVLAALLLAIGAIGDRWGHRRIVIFGFLCFFVGSLACSLSFRFLRPLRRSGRRGPEAVGQFGNLSAPLRPTPRRLAQHCRRLPPCRRVHRGRGCCSPASWPQ